MTIKTNQKKFWAYNYIFDVLGNKLKPNGIAVYLCLIRHANNQSQCYPSFKLIAEKCGMSRRTVIRTIDNLVHLDLIKVQKRKTDKNDYSSNLYFIKNINTEETTNNNSERVVTESHHPSDIESPPLVSESHYPSDRESPKGQLTEGKLYLKDDETKDEDKLKSPILLSEQTLKALHKLPDHNKKQEVLDVLAASMKKGTIRKPEAYLQTLIQRCLDGDFTPLKNSIPKKIFEKYRRQKINDCPYCDASGYIRFLEENGDMYGKACIHDKIERLPRKVVKILTAKSGYQQPGTQGLTHISELNVINSLRERYAEKLGDFEVPF